MLDLGASINLISFSAYKEVGIEGMKKTIVSLELVNCSMRHSNGIVEDILIQVDKLILPQHFITLDTKESGIDRYNALILLGWSFIAMVDTYIRVKDGILTMKILAETVKLKVFEALPFPFISLDTCLSIDTLDTLITSTFVQNKSLKLEQVLVDLPSEEKASESVEVVLEHTKPY